MKTVAILLLLFSQFLLCEVPREWESGITQAEVALEQKQFVQALKLLNLILESAPQQVEALELKALVFKEMGDKKKALSIYQKLFEEVSDKRSKEKKGLYAFEIGNLLFETQEYLQAKIFLGKAILLEKNVEASHFILGKIELAEQNWKASRQHFEKAATESALRSPAKLFTAQTYKNENRVNDALGAFVEARESAQYDLREGGLISEQAQLLAQAVLNTADKELRSFDRGAWIFEVGTSSGYDSNVLFVPNTGDANSTSTSGSYKQSMNWRARYSSSPTQNWQYLGTYQGTINYNFNDETRGGQFFVHDITQFLTRGFLKNDQYGFRLSGTGILQYRSEAFRPYSVNGSIGPFLRTKLSEDWWLGVETFFQPSYNYLDSSLNETAKRSGWEQLARFYLSNTNSRPTWSPSIYLTGALMRPQGTEFQGSRLNLDFSNSMSLSKNLFLAQTFGLMAAWYPYRSFSERTDQGFVTGFSGGYQFSQAFLMVAQVDFTKNFSSDSNFRYDRWSSSITGTFRF